MNEDDKIEYHLNEIPVILLCTYPPNNINVLCLTFHMDYKNKMATK